MRNFKKWFYLKCIFEIFQSEFQKELNIKMKEHEKGYFYNLEFEIISSARLKVQVLLKKKLADLATIKKLVKVKGINEIKRCIAGWMKISTTVMRNKKEPGMRYENNSNKII